MTLCKRLFPTPPQLPSKVCAQAISYFLRPIHIIVFSWILFLMQFPGGALCIIWVLETCRPERHLLSRFWYKDRSPFIRLWYKDRCQFHGFFGPVLKLSNIFHVFSTKTFLCFCQQKIWKRGISAHAQLRHCRNCTNTTFSIKK